MQQATAAYGKAVPASVVAPLDVGFETIEYAEPKVELEYAEPKVELDGSPTRSRM